MTPIENDQSMTECDMSEEGGITVLSLFLFIGMLMAAGLAVDVNNMMQSRTQLQGAADSAGHAALYWRWRNHTEADSKAKAIELARLNMPPARYGQVLSATDVEFGDWDGVNRSFDDTSTKHTAVRVTTRRGSATTNGIGTFLMRFIGMDVLDVNTVSVWDYEEGWCPRGEGFFATGIVDIQSNNNYYDGFCIHSETHVEFQQNSTFQPGVTVSMPNEADVRLPSSGLDPTKNPGLAEALESINYNLDAFFNDFPNLINRYRDPFSHVNSTLITDSTINSKKINKNLTASDVVKGAVNVFTCQGKTLTVDNNVIIQDAVVITDCEIKFNSGAAIENATVITTNTGSKSVSAPSGFRVGKPTFCTDGKGGANVLTRGDFTVASSFEAYGANIIADGNINVTANANGLAGINFMADGRIDATSNGDMGFCNQGPPKPFEIPVFKMVM